MYAEFFAYAINSLKQRSLRSWLTVLGIVIGIASIIVLVSLAQGLNAGISEQLEKFGSRTIVVIPGGSVGLQSAFSSANYRPPSIGKLYKNDAERLKKIEGVEYISTVIQTRPDISFKKESITASVNGIEPSVFKQTQALEIEKGRFLTDTDRQVAVIGEKIASDAFDEKVEVGSVFRMGSEKKSFRVVGVLKKSGSQSGMDSAIYVPVEDARSLAGDSLFENEVSAIRLTIVPDADIAGVKERITSELLSAHKLREEEKDFSLITSDFLKEQIGAITDMLSLFLGGVAAVSLIVGGVGIANTMFMAVLERTKEIGTLKAVGADEKKITKMFLIESGLLGFAGGLIGVALGVGVSLVLSYFGVPSYAGAELVLFCLLFSLAAGVLSGYFPAKRAAKMNAVDALGSGE